MKERTKLTMTVLAAFMTLGLAGPLHAADATQATNENQQANRGPWWQHATPQQRAHWQQMSPEQRRAAMRERWQHLSPAQRQQVQERMHHRIQRVERAIAGLEKKQASGTLTDQEKAQLKRLQQMRHRWETLAPRMRRQLAPTPGPRPERMAPPRGPQPQRHGWVARGEPGHPMAGLRMHRGFGRPPGMRPGRRGPLLGLTQEQRNEVRQIWRHALAASRKPMAHLRDAQRKLREATQEQYVNEEVIRARAREVGRLLGDLAVIRAHAWTKLRAKLSPEQFAQLRAWAPLVRERMHARGRLGPLGPFGPGPGPRPGLRGPFGGPHPEPPPMR